MALKERGFTGTLFLTVFTICFGSSFILGYNGLITNLPLMTIFSIVDDLLPEKSEESWEWREKKRIFLTFLITTNVVWMIGGAIGAFCSRWLADGFGRRNSLLLNHVIASVGVVFSAVCLKHYSLPFLGRFILGLNCGVMTGAASMYLVEIAPTAYRGSIGACHHLAVTIGIFISHVTVDSKLYWLWGIVVNGVPAITSLIILPFCPESPRFLLSNKKNEEAAKKAFELFNAKEDVNTFITELKAEVEVAECQPKFRFIQLFTKKDLRMAVAIACLVQILQQFSGNIATITYPFILFQTSGIENDMLRCWVYGIDLFNVVLTLSSLPLLERAGRRTLLLWPTVLSVISLVVFTFTFNLQGASRGNETLKSFLNIASILFMFIHVGGFALGLGPIPAMIVAEVFRQGSRAAAYSLSQGLLWLSNVLVALLIFTTGEYSFISFLIVVVVCWIFFLLYMPETKNRTFDEIAQDLSSGKIVFRKKTQS